MEPELIHSHGTHYTESPQNVDVPSPEKEEQQQSPGKTSVMHKVKARARKIRSSLAKRGIGKDKSNDHEEEEDDEDDEDPAEETVERPVYDAPSGEEERINPIVSSFNKMSVNDDAERKPKSESGIHDQFSPDAFPSTATNLENPEAAPKRFDSRETKDMFHDDLVGKPSDQFCQDTFPSTTTNLENPEAAPKSSDPRETKDMFHDNLVGKPSDQSTYTGAITDKALLVKNAVANKLGYGGETPIDTPVDTPMDTPRDTSVEKPLNQSTYMDTISSAAVSAKNVVTSKLGYGGNVETESRETQQEEGIKGPEKSNSMKDYLVSKLKPGEEDKALSEVITGALHKPPMEETKGDEHRTKTEVVSEAFHNRHEGPETEEEVAKLDKVTLSDDVKKHLGGEVEDPKEEIKPEQGTVGWITGTVNSWLGRGADSPTSPPPHISGQGAHGHDQNLSGEGKLESSEK